MPKVTWRLLVADDDPDICRQVKEYLDDAALTDDGDERLVVETVTDFDSVTNAVEHHRVDLLILDVRMQVQDQSHEKEAGERVLEEVQRRRFCSCRFLYGIGSFGRLFGNTSGAHRGKNTGGFRPCRCCPRDLQDRTSAGQPCSRPSSGNSPARLYVGIRGKQLGRHQSGWRPSLTRSPYGAPRGVIVIWTGDAAACR